MRHPVFIVGSPRSGTSALVQAMRSIGYKGYSEGNFLGLLHNVDKLIDRHYGWFPERDKEVLLSNVDKEGIKSMLFAAFRAITDKLNAEEPWFDKTGNPEMILAIPIVRQLWPDASFVFAKRRGIENLLSRMVKFPDYNFEYHCADWAANMEAWRTVREKLPTEYFLEVEQRTMVLQPEETARKLCTFLGASDTLWPSATRVMQTNRPQETSNGTASRTSSLTASGWTRAQTNTFLKHCEVEMKAYSYTLDEQYSVEPESL